MMNHKHRSLRSFTRLSLYTVLAATPGLAAAQATLEEIVVTARKTDESLQTTPVAVTAMTEGMLVDKGILKMDDLQRTAPSLTIGTGGTGPASIIYTAIRGQAQNSPNSVTDAAVGVYIDGVYLGRPIGSNLGFLDVGQVEVLRGPQGTLFGRNTTGGALTIQTNKPTNEFEGRVKAEVGNYDFYNVEGVLNLPVTDELATRFAYRYNERDGYYDNPYYSEGFKDVDESYSARGSVLYSPTEGNYEVFFSMDHEYYKDNGTPTTVVAFNDNARAAPTLPTVAQLFAASGFNPRDFEGRFDKTFGNVRTAVLDNDIMTPQNHHKVTGSTLDFKVDLGGAELRSITAYRESVSGNQNDLDGSPVDIIAFYSEYGHHQFSQELQLSGDIGKLNLIGGVYHFEEGGYEFSHAHQFGVFIQNLGIPYNLIPFDYRNTYSEYAGTSDGVFLQGNYEITEQLRLTAGYRYTRDTRDIERAPNANYIPQPGKPINCGLTGTELGNPSLTTAQARATPLRNCNVREDASFSYPAYVISLDYQLNDDTFLYAKHSRASMAGSLNTREVPPPFTFAVDPETVTDFEIGAKTEFLDSRVRANVAAFYMEGEDVQRIINAFNSAGTGLTQFNTNTGDTEIQGIELEMTALLWEGFELNFSASAMDGEYVSGTFNEVRGTTANPIIVDRSGEELPRLPEFSYSIGASQTFNLEVGELRAFLDYAYVDDQAIVTTTGTPGDAASIAAAAFVNKNASIDGYGLLNGRLSLTLNNPNIELAIWGRNLTDEEYATNVFESWTALGFLLHNQGNPRTYGASVEYRF
ncbi:MAG: TonB-dependent receptor [Pseudomonadota bacterium]|nr:TonB-dependent receptor [Pseudomonadota bacterium]